MSKYIINITNACIYDRIGQTIPNVHMLLKFIVSRKVWSHKSK